MSTVSWNAIEDTIRDRLLTWANVNGVTLASVLTGGLWIQAAPIGPQPGLWGTFRIIGAETGLTGISGRDTFVVEVMLIGRPSDKMPLLNLCADLCDGAMLGWIDSTSGLLFTRKRQRDTVPPFDDPADREVRQIRLLYPFVAWPRYLNDPLTDS